MASRLKADGHSVSSIALADIIIVNACTLTAGAERDARRFINRVRSMNKNARIVLAGCHAQVYPDQAFGADLILGQDEKFRIDELHAMSGQFVGKTRSIPMEGIVINGLPHGKTRVFLKIQDGCNQFCSYCVVPFARGEPRSQSSQEIFKAMKAFNGRGIKEVVLTGIELSAYEDPSTRMDLKGLLLALEHMVTPPRIRISSIDPVYLDDECIHIIASSKKIMKSLHIPLQSGSDDVLETMGRRYKTDYINGLVAKLHTMMHDIGIGMDVIVGFPTEDENRFTETCRFLEGLDIYYLHVFPFSPRKGTRAASLKDGVTDQRKKERVRLLRTLDGAKRKRFYERFIGKTQSIVAEGKLYRNAYMRGYTGNYIPVCVPYDKSLENNLVNVTIKEVRDDLVIGEPVPRSGSHVCG